MVYERLNVLRNLDVNRIPERQGAIDAAIRLLMIAGVEDPESKINLPSFQKESLSEAEQRANQLRERYRELLPDLTAMPINQFTADLVVYSPTRKRLETVSAFIDEWRDVENRVRIAGSRYYGHYWPKDNRLLQETIQQYIKNQQEETIQKVEFTPIEQMPLKSLNLSTRTYNTLNRYNPSPFDADDPDLLPHIDSVGTLCMRMESELLRIRQLGRFSLNEIKEKLGNLGVSLATGN